ncbi:MAG: threonine--tRNA ligase [Sulfurimonas sp. RIFOXYD12_FULL_33_39]|uniref:threonine--tRNA ligase n=1 Tax=unclassified Sulfurimonas TaxID=2623549 RepID=UPI0008D76CBA|nr:MULTISPECIES: threonine--tRNA ligase [unclassified Sulfurimonas]OHE05376.1 MAG: threonine--tRNA ligase [Sulfurimonas sp. RIFCSPLOWO2_12_FULL_34_6]OHE09850.1 MAG: threonine--tRNA ligase [Sulfurimonas sp. RIFOXYD12_FULL_33_39]OHE13642.1 MAG: threonine--tRNA ligase [Sulfurimonas sp. RIFOXYD2_FULL_34_21]DAB27370.1 MAG TPA: threonine--tRNA ligase [Sulfurimonas sp. UBA10385]
MNVIAIKHNGEIIDLQTAKEKGFEGEQIHLDNSPDSLEVLRHSTAHLMAQAIKSLYPDAKFYVGPTVKEGFYYDFKTSQEIGEGDLKNIEKEMLSLAKKKYEIEKYDISMTEAKEKFKNDHLKLSVMDRIPSERVSIYKQGDFEDLCRGPHLPNIGLIRYFKLTKIAGAYLGGDSKNEMLTRIYGIAFADKEALKAYLDQMAEAEKRDHRKLGNEMKLFTFREEVGAGFPIWLPAGGRLRARLESLLFKAHRKRGYEPVRGPEMLRSDLWKTSGHYQNYGENMYFTNIDEIEFGVKPMNCVGHIKVYEEDLHSYRDLPLKYFEYGVVHRHEMTGALHGLFRVREFTQDDAHIFCRADQIEEQIIEVVDFVDKIMSTFEFDYKMMISTKPEKAVGSDEVWEISTQALKNAMDKNGLVYEIDEGGGAFYGPKIDIKITDAIGREWQCGTIQLDFNLPSRFELEYNGENNDKIQPVMIHRAILGSFERFIGILTEHYAGEFPMFIAPTQVAIVPIASTHNDYAKELADKLIDLGADSEIYSKNDSLNKRIRTAEKTKVPMLVVIGDEEAQSRTVAIRDRRTREQYNLSESEFLSLIQTKINEVNF